MSCEADLPSNILLFTWLPQLQVQVKPRGYIRGFAARVIFRKLPLGKSKIRSHVVRF